MVEMIWKEPPAAISSEKAQILAALRNNPERWALVAQGRKSSGAADTWKKLGCEARSVRANPGEAKPEYDVYVRWVPRKAAAPVPTPPPAAAATRTAPAGAYDPLTRGTRGVPADGLPTSSLRRP